MHSVNASTIAGSSELEEGTAVSHSVWYVLAACAYTTTLKYSSGLSIGIFACGILMTWKMNMFISKLYHKNHW